MYKYDGSDRIDAEDGFYDRKTNSIYINKNHPLNRMSYATVLAHEYVHSLEIASEDYKALRDAVFSSSVYARYLKSAGTGERVSLTHDQHVQQIAAQYGFDGADAVERAEQEALANVLARDFLRNESRLVELARQDRNLFMKLWAWVRRMTARLGKSEETLKLEALFRKAAKASTVAHNAKAAAQTDAATDSATETQKHPTEDGGVQYSLPYMDAIDQLSEETLDRSQNTHLMVLEHTPEIYIKKANAKDLKIVMRWDIAYLAMNKNGDIPGHYHGLGKYVLKAIPSALEHPLYVVKQNNGRIAVVTEVVVKRARSVFVSVELDAFQSTTQEGKQESKNYNLIVTVMDAQPNYLQNTIFGGEIVYNKNNEDPAHFILRLKSLKKALPNDDHAKSSVTIIPDPSGKSNPQSSEDPSGDDSVQHSLPAISKEVADAVFEEMPDTSDPSPSLQYSLAPKRKIAYNEFWTEVHSWAHRATTNAGDMRVISDTRKGARPNTFCLFEADGDGDCTEIARGSYLEVLEEYERAYAKTIDEVYVCVEAYGADKGRDIWDMPPDEIGRYALGDYDTLEGLEFQRFPTGNVEYLRSGDQEISISDDIQLSLPDRTASQYLEKMLEDPSIAKATKAQIYADSPLYDVLHDTDRFAAAREILRDRDQLVDVVKRVSKGEAATAEEITAMILMQNAATTGAEQANASYIVATAARVAGRALRAFDRHNKLYPNRTPTLSCFSEIAMMSVVQSLYVQGGSSFSSFCAYKT